MTWLEIGCGGGYFISALNDFGVKNFKGIDKDAGLLKIASEYMGSRVEKSPINLADIVKKYPADIYVAFFVFEHMENSIDFFSSLSELPSGTLIIFSVPFFGLTHIFEKIITSDYARSFDGSVHTQIFTRQSVDYVMNMTGFEIVAEWIFGQDSADIIRHILNNINEIPKQLISKNRVIGLERDMQSIINKAGLADQRHFIAIKK
jgi:2-polyprenyl-3-methyl-5-hydroxy-6-metoxy-1,4-benzoquinol methylase